MVDSQIITLVSLARDKSKEARGKLVENITDLFLSDSGRLNEHERALMSDILAKLIQTVEADLRKELSHALADSTVQFGEVALLLANDNADIARPILERSKLIQDKDLIDIIRMRTDEHRLAISIREGLSVDVSDALIEYGNEDVIEGLLKNGDSNLSGQAMEYLVAESRRLDRYQEPLLNRDDLPSELAHKMYWWVTAALRKRIVTEFDVDPLVVDDLLQQATTRALVVQGEGKGAVAKAQKMVHRMNKNEELTHQFLLQSLRQQRIPVFVAGMSELAHVDYDTAWQVFNDVRCESLAILAKAIGVGRSDFTSMYLLLTKARDGTEMRPANELKNILDLFDSVEEKTAIGAIQYWQQNKAYQMAIEELDEASVG
ncbi:MAG: DUF2336 domain-containing protein [Sphingomonadales bacterium]|nr:DUF2336 domain-containing protein [Sphingomonadales bacterium]